MDIHTARQQLKIKSIYDLPMRVTYYARVSSEKDEQLNSLGNQITYYEDFIKKNQNWTYVEGYIDEGLSAATTKKRENFHRMVDDGKAGLFDFIITKEISRFARNTLDSISFTRELLNAGVGVFFQNDNINTLDEDSELRLTIMSGIAQDELRKLSSRVKFGHAQAIKKNVVLGNSRIFGYVKDGGRLVIDEAEAPMVRELFELYATGKYSMKQIENLFWEKGYRNHNGKKIAHTTMSGMISNPKYKGYYVGNKVKVIDLFTKKQKFLPPEEWVMFKDETGEIVPAIVSEEIWDAANAVLKKRSEELNAQDAALGSRIRELESLTDEGVLAGMEFDLMRQLLTVFHDNIDDMTVTQKRAAIRTVVRKVVWDGKVAHVVLFGSPKDEIDWTTFPVDPEEDDNAPEGGGDGSDPPSGVRSGEDSKRAPDALPAGAEERPHPLASGDS